MDEHSYDDLISQRNAILRTVAALSTASTDGSERYANAAQIKELMAEVVRLQDLIYAEVAPDA